MSIFSANNLCPIREKCERANLGKNVLSKVQFAYFDSKDENGRCNFFKKKEIIKYAIKEDEKTMEQYAVADFYSHLDPKMRLILSKARKKIQDGEVVTKSFYTSWAQNRIHKLSERYVDEYCFRENIKLPLSK